MSEQEFARVIALRRYVDVLYDIQDVRMRTANRLRQMPKESVHVYVGPLLNVEKNLTDDIEDLLDDYPIYTDFLKKVRGIGPRISGSIIAQTMIRFVKVSKGELEGYSAAQVKLAQKTERGEYLVPVMRGIGAFDTVSKYWAWWGLHVVDGSAARRRKGQKVNWNTKMKVLSWKIGKQFIMQGGLYREIYDGEKERLSYRLVPEACPHWDECVAKLKNRSKPACKGHIDAMAKRKAVKLFISHLWEEWRRMEGLPVRGPYVIDRLGHTGKIEPHIS